jgi:arylsulfotransferase ASST
MRDFFQHGLLRPVRLLAGFMVPLIAMIGIGAALPPEAHSDPIQVSTQPSLSPSFDPAVKDYVLRCAAGTPVQVTVAASAGTDVSVDGQSPQSGSFTADVRLNEGQGFEILATTGGAVETYYVRCLPADFPATTAQRLSQPEAEWYMVAPFNTTNFGPISSGVSPNYVAIFDINGVPVWWMKADHTPADFKLFSNGNLAWTRFDGTGDEEHRLDGSLAQFLAAAEGQTDIHEFLLLPNGNRVVTAHRIKPGFDVCGQSNVQVIDDGVQEIAPDGSLVWSWWASDHIDASETPIAWCDPSIVANGVYDIYHFNSAEPNGNGFMLSFRHLDAIYQVDKSDGSVVWKLGGTNRPESLSVQNDPLFTAGDGFRGQHDARVLSDGTVTLHDNGFHPSSQRPPRAIRYAIDLGARTATLVEQENDPGGIATPLCCGSARRLPGGDWLMSWGNTGLVTELSPLGAPVFSLTFDAGLFSYRAHPVLPGLLSRAALRAGMDAQHPRSYARPRGATLIQAALVPAYSECVSPNGSHAPPLSGGSCSPPSQTSSSLTVGTVSANSDASESVGSVQYGVDIGKPSTPANEADVGVDVSLTDVRRRVDLSDYTGQLQVHSMVRITDRFNGPYRAESSTGQDTDFLVTAQCTETQDLTIGATCSVSSSLNAIVPGAVLEGKRAIWQLGQVQVFDGGGSGIAGASDARLFETAGIFVP